ncbi:MAG: YitT family protein [Oscillospiraceae bacterium]|nr:YitT family protein [Oscillospiraceae bacterium]MDD4368030.1 YitT family protein [Oscillospiraceae bacterium]
MQANPKPLPSGSQQLSRSRLSWFLLQNCGLILLAAGIHFFKAPNHFAMGGTSGLSIIAATLVPGIDVGTFMFIVNGALLFLGFVFLGKKIIGATLYSSLMLSFLVWLLDRLWPMTAPFTADTLLELCYAVVLPAAGSAIIFNLGSSSGGTDILAMILAKYTSLEIGKALLLSDFCIALFAGGLYGVRTGLYCVLGLLAKAFVVDGVIDGINSRKLVNIVCANPEAVQRYIMQQLHRGATVYTASGAFSRKEEQVISTVLTRREAVLLRNFIRRTDPQAFITIVNSSETIGKNFRAI